ncbi:biotin--[acetyl-CoA-carboxylase] ligase [Pseudoclavibacter sp. RFBJ3]|nr:biotin--[acetyl-CoA-carboxylase] ligase [Pseudoclavibacter sp. RFBJ5]PPF91397.1 biotin--[acetyl-CoA-carboxylase] ligase [Pseudoclavibacter sp. RFBJ3]PPF96322.1 biotin--[acetyl-CoA-carboxylase] ligase [Pseudoclavibacter sp. RFBH5]PPG22068.1 biotin--[acetyl-CoA-carboxylase] ligase [Pseudoclavibacter sp. RFBI4]
MGARRRGALPRPRVHPGSRAQHRARALHRGRRLRARDRRALAEASLEGARDHRPRHPLRRRPRLGRDDLRVPVVHRLGDRGRAVSTPAITQLLLGGRAAGTELRLISVPEATSTNDVLADIWERTGGEASQNPALSTLVTYAQTAGVGRHGREWISPRGKCLAASTLVRLADDEAAPRILGWLPLIAGLALRSAILELSPPAPGFRPDEHSGRVEIKWPNDVQIDGRKVAGILGRVLGTRDGELSCVVGTGVNITLQAEELPTPHATSLALAGMLPPHPAELLPAYLSEFVARLEALRETRGDAIASGAHGELSDVCSTLRARVAATLPSGEVLHGFATELTPEGHLVIRGDDGETRSVAAGDVERVRPENGA